MPANLTPEYLKAEEEYKSASTPQAKLAALEEMLRTIPKHKGTEKMQADLKRRLSRLRKELQQSKSSGPSQRPYYFIEREGSGRVILWGPPNSGKSQLLAYLTSARPEVTDYPFATRAPQPGMMRYEDIQIQLIDMPPLAAECLEGWQLAMVEQADLTLILFSMDDPQLLEHTEFFLDRFRERGIRLQAAEPPKVILLANKMDLPGARENFEAWQELFRQHFQAEPFTAHREEDREHLKRRIFQLLDIVRVYTKAPGKKMEENPTPYVLKRGSTILDVASAVHKDLAQHLKFARVWGHTRFDGQMVERDYVVEDGDVVELHD